MDKTTLSDINETLATQRDRLLSLKLDTPPLSIEAVLFIKAMGEIDIARHLLDELNRRA